VNGLRFSPKQRQVLSWWRDGRYDGVICDGAARSGKTFAMTVSFFLWAMSCFQGQRFGICAATVNNVRRNVLSPVRETLEGLGFLWEETVSRNQIAVQMGARKNLFYLYGGGNEGSVALIQGVTLAGVMLDEAAVMPRAFVEQACARCSVEGAKVWFSCNPAGPEHWFYKEWILKAEEKRALYLHFQMEDNPSLSGRVRQRYERMFRGAFYRRYVLGQWVAADGLVYDFFRPGLMEPVPKGFFEKWRISCDYGIRNPASFGLWGRKDGVWYRVDEYYYDARAEGRQKTDSEYVRDLKRLAAGRAVEQVIVDPSAAGFIQALRREGWTVRRADNRVLEGIRATAQALRDGSVVICQGCEAAAREFSLYRWADDDTRDRVVKEHDHAMDEIRYFVMSLEKQGGVFAMAVER
jgi:PBSX family phage terminase large subunit